MAKLTLNLDALQVESFDTDAAGSGGPGTVHGNAAEAEFGSTFVRTCPTANKSCFGDVQSCAGTCITCPQPTDPCICDPIHSAPQDCPFTIEAIAVG